MLEDTLSEPMAADRHAKYCRERHKSARIEKKKKTCNEPRQLDSFIMCHLFLFEFFFTTNDIQFNCRLADNLSLSRWGLFEMSLDKHLTPYQDLCFIAENHPLCGDERAAKSID